MNSFQDKNKRKALIISLILYIGLAVLFLFIGLKYPDPPLEETGIEISMADFGYDDAGYGENEPTSSSSASEEASENVAPTEEVSEEIAEEEIVTQEESEISVPENTTEATEEQEQEQEQVEEQVVAEAEPEINENLKNVLGAWDETSTSDSEGSQEGTSGNEGIESGNVDGRGTFGGNGSSFELGGRSMIAGPKIGEKPTEEGKVVLNIWVDRQGNVLRTSNNLKESTVTSQYLFNLAKKAAIKAKFNALPSATPEQRGKMTFIFILQ
jgi:outer membrane biosynthesis protein TonB